MNYYEAVCIRTSEWVDTTFRNVYRLPLLLMAEEDIIKTQIEIAFVEYEPEALGTVRLVGIEIGEEE